MQFSKISEIFISYQGEGPFVGSRQLFVRFYGCNLECCFCDTALTSYKSFSRENLMARILDFGSDYNELTLTGGEPLLQADFLKKFLPFYKHQKDHRVFIETNGILSEELEKVIEFVDIISMDIKLPSSTGIKKDLWSLHERFAAVANTKELILKAVVTDSTVTDDIKRLADICTSVKKDVTVVLQPVTPDEAVVDEPDGELLTYFKKYLEKETAQNIMVLGQVHKCLGVK